MVIVYKFLKYMVKKTSDKQKGKITISLLYFIYLFVVWSSYRMSFRFSETLEELYIKPVIWLLPLLYIVPKDKLKFSDLGITMKNLFPSIYLSLALGVGFAFLGLLANFAKYGGINFGANIGSLFIGTSIAISFMTAITEELVFRGYLLGIFVKKYNEELSIALTTILWTAIHAPIAFFIWELSGLQIVFYLGLTFVYGLGASVLFIRTRNIIAPIFLHVLWEWPIILFR